MLCIMVTMTCFDVHNLIYNHQTGYLPDSVYRELAWYAILQIQPLHHSSKHKVAAHLIWQHTLGRPHVIMESPPQVSFNKPKQWYF